MYSFKELMTPVWSSDLIIDEALTMVEENGVAKAPLLFTPKKILSVTSADKSQEFQEGVDYTISGRFLILTKESRIFHFKEEEVCFDENKPGWCFQRKDGRYSLFHEGHFFHDHQLAVTYSKDSSESFSYLPPFAGTYLPRTLAKLQNKEAVKIVLYGDSISAGANASGVMMTTPFLPTFANLFAETLRRYYDTEITLCNPSVGGMATGWGMENAEALVGKHKPDLAIIAFGMNDGMEGEAFAKNIQVIKDNILAVSPDTEFILCATTMPNTALKGFYQHQDEYYDAMLPLQKDGIFVASFYHLQKALLEKKRFIDLTGNNVNHPNDFMIRCHAHLLCRTLIENF